MSKRALIPLLVGLGVGVFAIKLGLDVVKKAQGKSTPSAGVTVVVAKAPIPRATELTPELLMVVETTENLVPANSFSDPAALGERVSKVHIPQGMFISDHMLQPPGAKAGFESAIPSGYRAVAVKIDEYAAVGNWLKPGSHVDVLVVLTVRRDGGRPQSLSRVILRNIEVLAVGQILDSVGRGAVSGRSATLLVSERNAPRLHLASSMGKIKLALRGQGGTSDDDGAMAMASSDSLFDDEPPAPDNDTPSQDEEKAPSWMGLLSGLVSRAATQPELPAPMPEPEEPEIWTVTLVKGTSSEETIQFTGPRSSRRVLPADNQKGASAPAPRKQVESAETAGSRGAGKEAAKGPTDKAPSRATDSSLPKEGDEVWRALFGGSKDDKKGTSGRGAKRVSDAPSDGGASQ